MKIAHERQHLEKALQNENLAEALSHSFADWAVTLFFYSALHYVHAMLAVAGFHPESHEATGPHVRKHPGLKKIWAEYRSLHIASRNARYYVTKITPEHLTDVRNDFNTLRTYIRKQFA